MEVSMEALNSPVPLKPKPALRLVKTKDLPRDDWLAVRQQGIMDRGAQRHVSCGHG